MQPIQEPKGTYSQPPEGELIRCPHCNKILNHHAVVPAVPIGDNGNREVINLFGQPEKPVPPPKPDVPSKAIASGDIFVPEQPKVIGAFEQVATGQARPDKQELHVIPGMKPKQLPPQPKHPAAQGGKLQVLDNPIIGGKITVCVLLYGEDHHALHRRCLNSICQTVPPSRIDLRVACNQVGLETTNYLNTLPVTKQYVDHKNRRKYPAMRQMFFDAQQPIETNYVIWFDDDSYVLNPDWLSILAQTIVNQKPRDKIGMYGYKMFHPLDLTQRPGGPDPRAWFKAAKWFKNLDFRNKQGRGVPNGSKIHFVVGGFWAISREAIIACDIPDARLNHNGGDITIGEQLYQGGYKMKQFNENKQYVKTSGAPRRGFRERFPFY